MSISMSVCLSVWLSVIRSNLSFIILSIIFLSDVLSNHGHDRLHWSNINLLIISIFFSLLHSISLSFFSTCPDKTSTNTFWANRTFTFLSILAFTVSATSMLTVFIFHGQNMFYPIMTDYWKHAC